METKSDSIMSAGKPMPHGEKENFQTEPASAMITLAA
jgi:hypothetical protein